MEGKKISDSQVTTIQQMTHLDANFAGNVHGGVVMKHIDSTAGIVATRHAQCNVVTASIDRLDFISPVYIGDLLILKASVNMVGKTSMEIGVKVQAQNYITGETRTTALAYLTYVALDEKGKTANVPPLILENEEEIRRNKEAKARREMRLAERKREENIKNL